MWFLELQEIPALMCFLVLAKYINEICYTNSREQLKGPTALEKKEL